MEDQKTEEQYNISVLVEKLEADTDLDSVEELDVEIVVSRALGNEERLEAKVKVPMSKARAATLSLYGQVFTPRALTHIKETVDYQLEADRMVREMEKRNKAEQEDMLKNHKSKKGKK
jgi:hypothetical protein